MTSIKNIKSVSFALKNNSILPKDIFDQSLKVVESIKSLNAFTFVNTEIPKVEFDDRKLSCIPFAVKDNFCTDGIATTCASKALKDFVPSFSATVVERLVKESGVLLGKCNLDEFAMGSGTVDSVFGPTKNIWGSDVRPGSLQENKKGFGARIAGGSSGGCAVAVSSGACFAALGSDTGGSVRNPASYCGVIGYKPTYGTVSRHGLIPLVNSMDVPGILTRTVDDAAHIFNIISGRDPLDSTTVEEVSEIDLEKPFNPRGLKVGIPREYHCKGMSHDVLSVWGKVASLLQEGGAEVVQISMPHTAYSIACYSILNQCEVASNMARFDGLEYGFRADETRSTHQMFAATRSASLNQVVRGRILAGNYFLLKRNYKRYFEKALKVRRLISDDFKAAWDQVDVLLTPTTLDEAPLYDDFCQMDNREQCSFQDYCTQPANMSGCPAVSVPIQLSQSGMPLSVQLMAPNFNDEALLQVAKWIEDTVRFPSLVNF